ncbi:MAG TPA: LysM peptidoglycan-binding domain-containing protein [Ignavibacteria bacterium]|nr:LysM peptidoglycan-binding domain-containing protein [Ignavibacteria bacterium]
MRIDIKDNSNESSLKLCEYPTDCEYSGEENNENDLKIFIHTITLEEVDEYLSGDLNNEQGGVLLGEICINKEGKKFILINDLIIAKHSNSSLSRLTFTHETWDYINEVREKDFPEKKILGWFHSHPGHTVFLSNFDIFIQENFFNMYYMVAYVFDPTIKDRGFFLWRNDKIVKSGGYFKYGLIVNEDFNGIIKMKSVDDLIKKKSPEIIKKKNTEFKSAATIGLLLLTLLILLFMIYNIYEIKQKALLKDEYLKDLNDIKSENKKLAERLNDLIIETEMKKSISAGSNNLKTSEIAANEISSSGNTEHNTVNSSGSQINNNSEESNHETKQEIITTNTTVTKYKVKSGDTLEKISNQFYKSRAGIELLMKFNNIKNKADIKIGQELDIPAMEQ